MTRNDFDGDRCVFFITVAAVVILQAFKISWMMVFSFSSPSKYVVPLYCGVSVEQTRFNLPYVDSEKKKLIFITLISKRGE